MSFGESGQNKSFTITTTNATQTSLSQITVPENNLTWVDILVIAQSSTGVSALWRKQALIKDVSGTSSVVGSIVDLISPIKDLGALTWGVTITAGSGFINILVTGESGTTIEWATENDIVGYLYS